MNEFVQQFGGWIGLMGMVAFGFAAFFGLFDKARIARNKNIKKIEDDSEDRIIKLLNDTTQALEDKLRTTQIEYERDKQMLNEKYEQDRKTLNSKIDDLTKKVDLLEKENTTLLKVLQGRDEQTQEFYKKGFEAMKTMDSCYSLVKDLSTMVKDKNGNIEKLLDILGKQTDKIGETAQIVADAAKK